ncbi:MAG: hypothetical protein LBU89_00845 [Fibromonadaceae bacterium]|jgi:hypothetical protein|nr:hypothetical protein [Fibromonadaceae bacterium]
MANNVMGNLIGIPVAVGLKRQLPILDYIGNDGERVALGGNGGIGSQGMKFVIRVGNPGVVTEGSAIGDDSVLLDEEELIIKIYNLAYSMNDVEILKSEEDEEITVKFPKLSNLAKTISQLAYNATLASCGTAVSGNLDIGQIALGDAYLDNIGFGDEKFRAFSPSLRAKIIGSSQYYKANDSLSSELYEGLFKNFNGVDTVVVPSVKPINLNGTASWTINAIQNGAKGITLTGVTAGFKVEAGTPFAVAGLTLCNIYGEDLGLQRVFIAEKTVVATGTTLFVPTATIKFAGQMTTNGDGQEVPWAVPNTIGTPGTTATLAVVATGLYSTGAVSDKKAIQYKTGDLAKVDAPYSESISLEGELGMRLSGSFDIRAGVNSRRVDVLFGVKACNIGGVAFYSL